MVPALVRRLDRWLAANRPEYYARLQPGVSDGGLDAFEARFTLKLPVLFREFYRWRNGQEPTCTASFQDNRMFSSLEEVAEAKETLAGMIGSDFEDPGWWRRGWLRFLANGSADYLCLDVTAEAGGRPGQIVAFWHDWEDRSVEYNSFEEWLQALVGSMEGGTRELA